MFAEEPRKFLIKWNNNYPFDRRFRKKYNIAFNSEEHKDICQIDVVFDLMEDDLFEQHFNEYKKKQAREDTYFKEGKVFEELSDEEELARYHAFLPEDPERLRMIENGDSSQPIGLGG